MKSLFFTACLGWLTLGWTGATEPEPGTQTRQSFTHGAGTMDYWLWLPKETPAEGAPLIVFLHGSGERGDDPSVVRKHGPPKLVESMPALQPFMVVSPQCPAGQWWDVEVIKALTDAVVAKFRPNPARLYLTGLSMGGYGTWALAAKYPDFFAAAVPVCGGGDPAQAGRIKDLPLRVYHGAKDEAVPLARSQEMVDALKAAGAADVELIVYPELAHDSWTPTYDDPGLYTWLLTKQRK